jgi:hypothetical protein
MRNIRSYLFLTPDNSDTALKRIIDSTLGGLGLKGLPLTKTIDNETSRLVDQADLVIADVSGSDPDIMYMVGMAQGGGKVVLPIVGRDEKELPSTLGRIQYLVYDPIQPESFRRPLKFWAQHLLPVSSEHA